MAKFDPKREWRLACRKLQYIKHQLDPFQNKVIRRTDFANCERPVLLLQGLFDPRRSMDVLEERLRADGYGVFSIDLNTLPQLLKAPNTRGIGDLADLVRDKIDRLYRRFPTLGPLSIVGFSKGGLIACYYVKRLGGDRLVQRIVTLGTPHRGTPRAYLGIPFGPLAPSLWQMAPMSPFIRRLRAGPWPEQVRLVSIYSRDDFWVPYPTALVEEDDDQPGVLNIEVPETPHRQFLTSQPVYEQITKALRSPSLVGGHERFRLVVAPHLE